MTHQVQVNQDAIVLPDGREYNTDDTPTITNAQFDQIRPELFDSGALTDLSSTPEGGGGLPQPGPGVHLSRGPDFENAVPQTIPDATWTPIVWTDIAYDGTPVGARPLVDFLFANSEYHWLASAGSLVVQPTNEHGRVGFVYAGSVDVYWDTAVSTGTRKILTPGLLVASLGGYPPESITEDTTHSGAQMVIGLTGEQFTVIVYQDSGAPLDVIYTEAWVSRRF
jgi:hypothetical protein